MTDYADLISRLEKASADHPCRWHGFDDERGDAIHRTITDARDAIETLQVARCELRNALVAVKLWRQTVGLGGSLWDLVTMPSRTSLRRRLMTEGVERVSQAGDHQ